MSECAIICLLNLLLMDISVILSLGCYFFIEFFCGHLLFPSSRTVESQGIPFFIP